MTASHRDSSGLKGLKKSSFSDRGVREQDRLRYEGRGKREVV